MSDSDDTDLLLLIPPDFFLVQCERDLDLAECGEQGLRDIEREVVSDLITQVNDLESRICAIESSEGSRSRLAGEDTAPRNDSLSKNAFRESPDSLSAYNNGTAFGLGDSSLITDDSCLYSEKTEKDKWNNVDNLDLEGLDPLVLSLNSVRLEEKDRSVFTMTERTSPLKSSAEIMRSSLDDPLKCGWTPTKRLDLPAVDKLLKEMEITQAEIENKLRSREMEFGTRNQDIETKVPQVGDTIHSVPNLGFGIRDLLYRQSDSSPSKNSKENAGDLPTSVVEEPCIRQRMSLLTCDPRGDASDVNESSRWKTFKSHGLQSPAKNETNNAHSSLSPERRQRFVRRRLHHGSLESTPQDRQQLKSTLAHEMVFGDRSKPLESARCDPTNEGNHFPEFKNPEGSGSPSKVPVHPLGLGDNFRRTDKSQYTLRTGDKLLSLNQLWQGEDAVENPVRLKQKLEEEKYRRLHLEQTIQRLQKKVLEEQEKLAVAIRVDEEKDRAINQITDGWRQMVNHWKKLEEQRHEASQALLHEKIISKKIQDDVNKKIERWEKEVSQALDLAASFKSKCQGLEVDLSSTQEALNKNIRELEDKYKQSKDKIAHLEEERQQLANRLQISEDEHSKERKLVVDARKDLAETKESLSRTEAELAVCKEQRDLLSTRLKEERNRNGILEKQKIALQESVEEIMAKQVKAEEEAKSAMSQLETVKTELRALYQGQLEAVVKEKLAEFQSQLDAAQVAMQNELKAHQQQAQEKSIQQQQALVNSHVAEMRRLESIHKEELHELQIKLADAEKRCARLESGKKEVAQKLHSLMEAQWQQALSIITSELSMRQVEPEQAFRNKNNKVSANRDERNPGNGESNQFEAQLNLKADSGTGSCLSLGQSDDAPYYKSGPLTYRVNNPTVANPPVKQDQLFKYVQMLLEKQPGHPVDSMTSSGIMQDITQSDLTLEEPNLENLKWNEMLRTQKDTKDGGISDTKSTGKPKPPWK